MNKIRIHSLQHVPFEGLGSIENWAKSRKFSITYTQLYKEEKLPKTSEFDFLIIMGGPMGANDEKMYPWLKEEKKLIRKSIDSGKIVLGICLGAQLIAYVLGAEVYPNPKKEIGWFAIDICTNIDISKGFTQSTEVLHWHGDTFDLPKESIRLFESEACKNQAFLYKDSVLGLQFHLEITDQSLQELIDNCRKELIIDDFVQSEEEITSKIKNHTKTNFLLDQMLDNLIRNVG